MDLTPAACREHGDRVQDEAQRDAGGVVDLEFPEVPKFDSLPQAGNPQGKSAFLAVQEGCDKFCTFCVVPYTRGAEYSRSVDEVVTEAKQLAARGVVEIMLRESRSFSSISRLASECLGQKWMKVDDYP